MSNGFSKSQLERIRELFPHVKTGQIYFNHASTSPLSTPVVNALSQFLRERSDGTLITYEDELKVEKECREAVRGMINAESVDRISLVGNTSDSINIVSSGLPWKAGDRIILNDVEFPANVYPYYHLQEGGVAIDFIKNVDGKITPQMIADAVTPRTRVVALSAVQYLTGYRADMKTIGTLCRDKGIWFVVDGIQAVGAVQMDVQEMKIDALGAGAQKWQMSTQGTGFLYLTEALRDAIRPMYVGWLAAENAWDFSNYGQPLVKTGKRFEGGTVNRLGFRGMTVSLNLLLDQGMANVERHILGLTGRLAEGLSALDGVTLISPSDDEERAGIVTIAVPPKTDASRLFKKLLLQNIVISIREGKLRFSPHFYNSSEEIDKTIEATRELIQHG
jgi:cysteine desulfurase/selenocysteine lyase